MRVILAAVRTMRAAALALTMLAAGCAAATTPPARPAPSSVGAGAVPSPATTAPAVSVTTVPPEFPIPVFPPAPIPVKIPVARDATPVLHRIPTHQKVAFLTIDDGYTRTAVAPRLIAAAHIPVTMFLTGDAVRADPEYFRPMPAAGAVIEDHTLTHPELRGRSYAVQRHQICGSADYLATTYGRRPILFRPPFGDEDATTLRAAHDCGMRVAVLWTETVDKGIVRFQGPDHHVQPGDIILMHFRPAFEADFLAALRAIARAGLTPARLDDYLDLQP